MKLTHILIAAPAGGVYIFRVSNLDHSLPLCFVCACVPIVDKTSAPFYHKEIGSHKTFARIDIVSLNTGEISVL